MPSDDAEYFWRRRRAQEISERDPFTAREFRNGNPAIGGLEMRRLEQLPWPTNVFGQHATIAELLAEVARPLQKHRASLETCVRVGAGGSKNAAYRNRSVAHLAPGSSIANY